MTSKTSISIKSLSFSYSQEPVLRSVDLQVRAGEFVGVIGGIGSGKTTFLQSLNGIIPHLVRGKYSGSVEIFGETTQSKSVQGMSRRVAFVFQDPSDQLFCETVEKEVAFALENRGGLSRSQIASRVKAALDEIGISALSFRDPTTLSQGQKQKVALACAIAMDTDILVLDEPTSSLDHKSSLEIYGALLRLNRNGKTIIVSEHDTELLAEYVGRVLLLNEGKIALDGGVEILAKSLVGKLGIKIPCSLEVSRKLVLKDAFSPGELAGLLSKKRGKQRSKKLKEGRDFSC